MNLPTLFAAAAPAAWLLPNHYFPWLSAWQEGLALALVLSSALVFRGSARLSVLWAVATALAVLALGLHWVTGRILFAGDALLVALYLLSFALALALGARTQVQGTEERVASLAEPLAIGIALGALLSAATALVQWTGALHLGIWMADLPPGARPFGNVAQPNHLCTIAFLGITSVALLREAGRLGAVGFWLASSLLVFTMVMSGSRTGWLQFGVALALLAFASRRTGSRVRPAQFVLLAGLFVVLSLAWPAINEALMLSGERTLADPLAGSGREVLWPALLDAIWREPWLGYGWQQMVLAQQAVALDHPPILRHFEYSHNLVLDLLVWVGLPFGVLIVLLAGWALWRQAARLSDARALWLLAGVLGVVTHAMLEYPLAYAYFLLPVGLMLGAVHALTPGARGVTLPRWAPQAIAMPLLLLLGTIAVDYLKAEQNYRVLRLESARIGVTRLETPAPDLLLLDHLQAFLSFARTEAAPGMSPAEVDSMRRVSERFAYPPAMFRYALAAGLKGSRMPPRRRSHACAACTRRRAATRPSRAGPWRDRSFRSCSRCPHRHGLSAVRAPPRRARR